MSNLTISEALHADCNKIRELVRKKLENQFYFNLHSSIHTWVFHKISEQFEYDYALKTAGEIDFSIRRFTFELCEFPKPKHDRRRSTNGR